MLALWEMRIHANSYQWLQIIMTHQKWWVKTFGFVLRIQRFLSRRKKFFKLLVSTEVILGRNYICIQNSLKVIFRAAEVKEAFVWAFFFASCNIWDSVDWKMENCRKVSCHLYFVGIWHQRWPRRFDFFSFQTFFVACFFFSFSVQSIHHFHYIHCIRRMYFLIFHSCRQPWYFIFGKHSQNAHR